MAAGGRRPYGPGLAVKGDAAGPCRLRLCSESERQQGKGWLTFPGTPVLQGPVPGPDKVMPSLLARLDGFIA